MDCVLAACARSSASCWRASFLAEPVELTTSPPLAGLCGSSSDGALLVSPAGLRHRGGPPVSCASFGSAKQRPLAGVGAVDAVVAVGAAVAAGASATCSNLTPNGTDGLDELLDRGKRSR